MISFRTYIHTLLLMMAVVLSTGLSGCTTAASSASSTPGSSLSSMEEIMADPSESSIEPTVLALVNRDYDILQGLMADSFVISSWDSAGTILAPAEATEFLRTEYFEQADSIVVGTATDIVALLGFDLLAEIDGRAFYLEWSSGDTRSEGLAVLERLSDGGFHWPYILIAKNGFGTPMPILNDVEEPSTPSRPTRPAWEAVQIDNDPGRVDRLAILENGLGYQQYLVNAQAGQVLMVNASSESTVPIDLMIMSPSGLNQLGEDRSPDPSEEIEADVLRRSWYVNGSKLSESGDYVISLATLDGYSYAEYKVVIELYTPPDEEVPAPQSAVPPQDAPPTEEETTTEESVTQESDPQESLGESSLVRIELDPEEITTIPGYIAFPDSVNYLMSLKEGQTVSLQVTSTDGLANFSLIGMTEGQIYKPLTSEDRKFIFTSSVDQDYEIAVSRSEGDSTYGLYVRLLD